MSSKALETATVEFTQAIGLLVRRVRSAAASHELSLTESAVLARLAREGPATTADLARAERIRPQSMGATVAALGDLGLIERRPHPSDGRQVYIQLTAKGSALRDRARDAKHTWLAQAIARLGKEDQETLFAAGEVIARLARS